VQPVFRALVATSPADSTCVAGSNNRAAANSDNSGNEGATRSNNSSSSSKAPAPISSVARSAPRTAKGKLPMMPGGGVLF
jgi:hypothetical protein